jgi:hypothetical protein
LCCCSIANVSHYGAFGVDGLGAADFFFAAAALADAAALAFAARRLFAIAAEAAPELLPVERTPYVAILSPS